MKNNIRHFGSSHGTRPCPKKHFESALNYTHFNQHYYGYVPLRVHVNVLCT